MMYLKIWKDRTDKKNKKVQHKYLSTKYCVTRREGEEVCKHRYANRMDKNRIAMHIIRS